MSYILQIHHFKDEIITKKIEKIESILVLVEIFEIEFLGNTVDIG